MRNLSRTVIGLLLGAAMVMPIAAQAQDRGRERGGWQRGGGGGENRQRSAGENRAGWQRGGMDRGAMINGDARREAIRQGREASRAVERPARAAPPPRTEGSADRSRRDWSRDGGTRPDGADRRFGRSRDTMTVNDDRQRRANRGDNDRNRDWNRGDRDRQRNWDRNDRHDGSRSWTSDRRDWNGRDWDRRNSRWDRDWRNDRRYSWKDHRSSHRHIYRLPRYETRFGHSYRRWSTGYRFDPWLYSSSYWINDPWQYRLPPAYGAYRWVRYYDDVVLVDTRTGEIVDIIYDFFF